MSAYDPYKDTPGGIASEGGQIELNFTKVGNTGEICWNIPTTTSGAVCDKSSYNGILLLIDTKPIDVAPADGKYYVADFSADPALHAGDSIGDALVIGAYYDDKTTISATVHDIATNTPYYVAAYAVDNTARYHTVGVRSYSRVAELNTQGVNTAGYNVINLDVATTTPTLLSNTTHELTVSIDGVVYTLQVNGGLSTTYAGLLSQLNYAVAHLDTVTNSTTSPGTGNIRVDLPHQSLYKWDGAAQVTTPCVFSPTAVNALGTGAYWANNGVLKQWDGLAWVIKPTFNYARASNQVECADYWYNGVIAYNWDGNVWVPRVTFNTAIDPTTAPRMACNTFWYDTVHGILYRWEALTDCLGVAPSGHWVVATAISTSTAAHTIIDGEYWYTTTTGLLRVRASGTWNNAIYASAAIAPATPITGAIWYNTATHIFKRYDGAAWVIIPIMAYELDPSIILPGMVWFNSTTGVVEIWDAMSTTWIHAHTAVVGAIDPSIAPAIITGSVWYNPSDSVLKRWDGADWCPSTYFTQFPGPVASGDYWYNTTSHVFSQWDGTTWVALAPITTTYDPSTPLTGSYWYNTTSNVLSQWDGTAWVPVAFTTSSISPVSGALWYDVTNSILYRWNGSEWLPGAQRANFTLNTDGNVVLTSAATGSASHAVVYPYVGLTTTTLGVFGQTSPVGVIQIPVKGTDAIPTTTMMATVGVGTDGSVDERETLVKDVSMSLGFPSVKIELSKDQMNMALNLALNAFRLKSSTAYERALFFMDLAPNQQNYFLTDATIGYNKIVRIQSIQRQTSAFLGNANGNGIFGQTVLQHLYSMGTYDMISYHLISSYIESLEILFATRIVFRFNERTRRLDIFQAFSAPERVLVTCTIERTEQELMSDRISSMWIRNWALAECYVMLANIRGKFSSLPGAGGGISLNASDCQARADALFTQCQADIDDFVVQEPENTGLGSTIVIG